VLSEKSSRLNLSDTSPEESTKTTSWRRSGQTPKSVHSGGWTKNNPESVCSGTGRGSVDELSEEQKEHVRLAQIGRRKDFVHVERVNGKATNVLRGLELHTGVFNAEEQKMIVECVYSIQRKGQSGQLRGMYAKNLGFCTYLSLICRIDSEAKVQMQQNLISNVYIIPSPYDLAHAKLMKEKPQRKVGSLFDLHSWYSLFRKIQDGCRRSFYLQTYMSCILA